MKLTAKKGTYYSVTEVSTLTPFKQLLDKKLYKLHLHTEKGDTTITEPKKLLEKYKATHIIETPNYPDYEIILTKKSYLLELAKHYLEDNVLELFEKTIGKLNHQERITPDDNIFTPEKQ